MLRAAKEAIDTFFGPPCIGLEVFARLDTLAGRRLLSLQFSRLPVGFIHDRRSAGTDLGCHTHFAIFGRELVRISLFDAPNFPI